MKKIMILSAVAVAFCAVAFAAGNTDTTKKPKIPLKEAMLRKNGGQIRKPNSGQGTIVIYNTQKAVAAEALEAVTRKLDQVLLIDVKVASGEKPVKDAEGMKGVGAQMLVNVTECDCRNTLILSPEQGWATVNVTELKKDGAKPEDVAERTRKEIVRAIGWLAGLGDSRFGAGLMVPVAGLADIDAIMGEALFIENYPLVNTHFAKFGIKPHVVSTYRKACEEGWAPKPVNDYQKAIWEEVHELPSNPIKIKYDPKTDK